MSEHNSTSSTDVFHNQDLIIQIIKPLLNEEDTFQNILNVLKVHDKNSYYLFKYIIDNDEGFSTQRFKCPACKKLGCKELVECDCYNCKYGSTYYNDCWPTCHKKVCKDCIFKCQGDEYCSDQHCEGCTNVCSDCHKNICDSCSKFGDGTPGCCQSRYCAECYNKLDR